MAPYPVHFIVDKPLRYSRTQLFVRALVLIEPPFRGPMGGP